MAGVVLPESVACVAKDGFTILYYIENKLPFETDLYTADQLRQAIADALAKRELQGYKLMPVEPTQEILKEMRGITSRTLWNVVEVYEAAIAAAPDPKEAV